MVCSSVFFLAMCMPCSFLLKADMMYWVTGTELNRPSLWGFVLVWLEFGLFNVFHNYKCQRLHISPLSLFLSVLLFLASLTTAPQRNLVFSALLIIIHWHYSGEVRCGWKYCSIILPYIYTYIRMWLCSGLQPSPGVLTQPCYFPPSHPNPTHLGDRKPKGESFTVF